MRKLTTIAILGGLVAGVLPASAHNLNPPPSRVDEVWADVTDAAVEIGGQAFFGGQRILTLGTDPAEDFTFGPLDLTAAQLAQLDPSTGTLTFVLKVRDLPNIPANSGIPEVGRYLWDFGIDMGGESPVLFSIDGRLTNVAAKQSTRVPAFELQSNCTTDENNIITCPKVADLEVEMIGSTEEIFIDIPLSVLQEQAGGSVLGRKIVAASICDGISAKVSPVFAACGGPVGGATSDILALDAVNGEYTIAYKRARVTVAPVGGGPSQTVEATVNPNATFDATIPTASLAPGTYTVTAEACYGTNCATRATEVTIF